MPQFPTGLRDDPSFLQKLDQLSAITTCPS